MDWTAAIEAHRDALRQILAALIAMSALVPGMTKSLPRHLHRAALRLLRPTEAAVRRLIIASARGLVVPPPRPSSRRARKSIMVRNGVGTGLVLPPGFRLPSAGPPRKPPSRLCLPLVEPLRPFRRRRPAAIGVPRITVPGVTVHFQIPSPPTPDDMIDANRLGLRIAAVAEALDDLPGQARRFARWRARRDRAQARGEFSRLSPLKPGMPRGCGQSSGRRRHQIFEILAETQWLAWKALQPDTS